MNGRKQAKRFGTFGGVFTPSVLTILGVIMFLRYAQVLGYAGFWGAMMILVSAKIITLSTGLSLSSISTNMKVRGGGAYYMISRSLGAEFGGMIAIFFYLAQTVAVTLYVVGFSEALFSAFPDIALPFHTVALITNCVVFIIVYIGAGWTIKIQYLIFVVLMLSILSFAAGALRLASPELLQANLRPAWTPGNGFFAMFALFFPAVTGIMAGVNMSGDLKEPRKSLPRGTLLSIGFTFLIYVGIALLFALSNSRESLLGPEFVMRNTAWSPALVLAGVFAATISSALGSMMGAPRILQAFSRDKIFKRLEFFAKGSGASAEPRRAVLLTFLISSAGIFAGDLNTIAPVITMFFLLTYGTLNLACFYEMITRNPSFRPAFRVHHWSVALLGALGSLAVMFLINAIWALVAIILAAVMYYLILRSEILVQWGDMNSGLAFQRARASLLRLEQEKYHPKNWRPSILALSGGKWNRANILHYACVLSADRGIVSLAQIISGELKDRFVRREEAERLMRKFIREENLPAFPVVLVDDNFSEGLKSLLQAHGIGGLKPNMLLLGWTRDTDRSGNFPLILDLAKKMKRSLLVVRNLREDTGWSADPGDINIWWNDALHSSLSLMMAFLLKQNQEWRDKTLRIIRPVAEKADVENIRFEMEEMLKSARMDAELCIIPAADPLQALQENLGESAILFIGFDPESDPEASAAQMAELRSYMELESDIVLVYNAGDVSALE
ncbi:MAG: amino acid permease [Candidatus Neomarinimicrobiota bacterium]|jgi:amino acid transporter|nr:amino acid permease [Candidatus Neomarinimicrobiota bacterium]MDX9779509.1 amino acid permease [bacterium]